MSKAIRELENPMFNREKATINQILKEFEENQIIEKQTPL